MCIPWLFLAPENRGQYIEFYQVSESITSLRIKNNPLLQNVDGLENMTYLKDCEILWNSQITNLDGFTSLDRIDDFLIILENPELTDFCGLTNSTIDGKITITGNGYNPDPEAIFNGNCSS